MKNKVSSFAVCLSILIASSCASIIHGNEQEIDFTSQPDGAKIFINGIEYGTTPATINLKRRGRMTKSEKTEYDVQIALDGFYPYEMKIKREMDGWFLGNVIFGGLIGIIIDASTGAMYKLTPDQMVAQMKGSNTMIKQNEDGNIYIAVTLEIDPKWQQIGLLNPAR